jgi:lysyl-tRNA synthetase class 2
MLEAYEAFGSWETMADLVEEMIFEIAEKLFGALKIEHKAADGTVRKTIDLKRPWRRVTMAQLVEERTGWKFDKRPLQEANPELFRILRSGDEEAVRQSWFAKISKKAEEQGVELSATGLKFPEPMAALGNLLVSKAVQFRLDGLTPAEQLVEVYEKLIEPTLTDPTFVTHVPGTVIPLAKRAPEPGVPQEEWFFADVYELAINGQEISPGYTELNDPDVQARQFAHQVGDREEQQQVDEDFLNALRYGMPPAGGMGLGIDRLVMMLTGAESIRDIILFPLMKPQE